MATNNYFKNFNSFPQQELLNDLTREVIQMNGTDVLYLPRFVVKNDEILGEDTMTKFTLSFEIEMYIETNEAYGGAGDIGSKFGLEINDEIILIVNRDRFKNETTLAVPNEGDLIYVPLVKGLFELKFVEDEKPFYSLGTNNVYKLICEKFQYSNEKFEIPAGQMGEIFEKFERQHSITTQLTVATGAGKFLPGDSVYQGDNNSNLATGKAFVSSFNTSTNILQIYNVVGVFASGEVVKTLDDSVSRNVTAVDDQVMANSPFADNKAFEDEGDSILDFSELDPWSEGDL